MNKVTIFTVDPTGDNGRYTEAANNLVEDLSRYYEKFKIDFSHISFDEGLNKGKGGLYSVKSLRSKAYEAVESSLLFCMVILCKKDEVQPDEMNILAQNFIKQKKAEVVIYFKMEDDIQPIWNDIMRRITVLDDSLILPKEDREPLFGRANQVLNLGVNCEKGNRMKEAEAAFKESLIMMRKLTIADEDTYLPSLSLPYHNLGALYVKAKRYKEAEIMFKENVGIRKKLFDKKGEKYAAPLASAFNSLGIAYFHAGNIEEAVNNYNEALRIREKLAVSKDTNALVELADICGNLGNLYNSKGDSEKAEEYFARNLKINEELLEKDPSDLFKERTAQAANTIGVLCIKLKRAQEAEVLYMKSLKLYMELSKENPDTYKPSLAMVYYNLGNICHNMKRFKEGEVYMQKAYDNASEYKDNNAMCKDICKTIEKARSTGIGMLIEQADKFAQQAQELREKGEFMKALTAYEMSIERYKVLKDKDKLLKAALLSLEAAQLQWDFNNLEKAEIKYKDALNIYTEVAKYDEDILVYTAIASYNLGIFLQDTKDEELNEYLRNAFEISKRFKDTNEQCHDIYENLMDEPFAGKPEEVSEDENLNNIIETDTSNEKTIEKIECNNKEQKGWFQKIFKKK